MRESDDLRCAPSNAPKTILTKWASLSVTALAKAWRIDRQSLMRVLVLLGVTIGIVTNCVGFVGLSNGHYGGAVIGVGLAILLSAASAVCFGCAITSRIWSSRLGWAAVWLFCASMTVSIEFGFWFYQGSGDQLASKTAQEAARQAAIPLTTFASDYLSLSDQANGLKELSAAKATEEGAKGFTCDPSVGANPGPRQRLRDRDAATFAQYARAFDTKKAELQGALHSLDSVYGATGPAFYATASSTIGRAYATAVAANQDPNLQAFRGYLQQRIRESRSSIPDPQTGELFKCPDQELEARMQAALAVQLSGLPPMPTEIVEPTLASAAGRPFILMRHPSRFEPDLDLRPLLLGLLVDVLPCVFVAALLRAASTRDPEHGGRLGSKYVAHLSEALHGRSTIFSQLHQLREGYAHDESWIRFLDRYAITVPATRRSEATLDLLVVPSTEDPRAFGARVLALVLTGDSRSVLLYSSTFKDLAPRWREKLGPGWDSETSFDVYRLEAGLLNELIIAAAAFEAANASSFRQRGSAPENGPACRHDERQEGATPL